jgi:hypothetical protein
LAGLRLRKQTREVCRASLVESTTVAQTCRPPLAALRIIPARIEVEIERLNEHGLAGRGRADGDAPLIGSSQAIRAVRERIERVAATDFRY